MMRSRVSSSIDFSRLSQALMRPGIDPRVWVSYAVLKGEPVVDLTVDDGSAGVFVDLILLPTQQQATARVGALYAGNGFGLYAPLHKDDEVLVVAPSGDPAEGLVVTQRLWSPSDPPPAAVAANPDDVTLVVEPTKSLRLNVQGGGKVYLGGDVESRGVARLNDTTQDGTLSIAATSIPGPPPVTTLTLTYTPPGGTPQVASIALTPCEVTPVNATFNLAGAIDSASAVVESV